MSIKNKAQINLLFTNSKSMNYGVIFAKVLNSNNPGFLFAVSSKKFKRAVDRNKIKRLMRESVKGFKPNKDIALIYIGDKIPTFLEINESISKIIKRI